MNSMNLNTDPHYLNACLIDDIQYALSVPSSVLRNAEGNRAVFYSYIIKVDSENSIQNQCTELADRIRDLHSEINELNYELLLLMSSKESNQ